MDNSNNHYPMARISTTMGIKERRPARKRPTRKTRKRKRHPTAEHTSNSPKQKKKNCPSHQKGL